MYDWLNDGTKKFLESSVLREGESIEDWVNNLKVQQTPEIDEIRAAIDSRFELFKILVSS